MIEPSHPGLDEQCLARPPAVVRLGSGGRYAVVVTLIEAILLVVLVCVLIGVIIERVIPATLSQEMFQFFF